MSISKGGEENRYGFHYFDKPGQGGQREEDEEDEGEIDEFDIQSCTRDCCDEDCECDDCMRCQVRGIQGEEGDYSSYPAAAA